MKIAKRLIAEINLKSNQTLSSNEAKILHWVFVSGLLSFRALWKTLIPNARKASLHRSARRLVKRGLIEPVPVPGLSLPGWRLSRNLLINYSREIGMTGCGPYRFVVSLERHNELVRELARLIDSSMETLWIAHELMLRAHEMANGQVKRNVLDLAVPDLLTAFPATNGLTRIAWEVELTQKSGERMERILDNRMTSEHWDATIYILGSGVQCANVFEKSKEVAVTSPKLAYPEDAKPILFVSWESLRNQGLGAKGLCASGEMSIPEFITNVEKRLEGEAEQACPAPTTEVAETDIGLSY